MLVESGNVFFAERVIAALRRRCVIYLFAVTATYSLLPLAAQTTETRSPVTDAAPALHIQHAVNVVGLGDLKADSVGDLVVDRETMSFTTASSTVEIRLRSIKAFSISHDDVPLIGGTTGAIASVAPYGVGQAVTLVRPAADTFTLVYTDSRQAVHGSVLLLPKGRGDEVSAVLAKVGLFPRAYPQSGPIPVGSISKKSLKQDMEKRGNASSIRVTLLTESVPDIPAAFPVAVYENLLSQLTSSLMFQKVWRQGDTRADSDVLTLHVNILEFKKGNARTRGLVPFLAPTVLKATIQITDGSNKVIFSKQINAAKRMHGENMSVTNSFAKKVKSELLKVPGLGLSEAQ